ncbi:MAG: carbohydrate ABC transporter permease [Clostridiales bacterium]|jgi:ABC-type glycerol-3-phosphate transport system permease component|nr:carbohydrate ABC transporter permease [Clostridiales bacterium]
MSALRAGKAPRKWRRRFGGFDVFVTVFCLLFALVCFFPLWYVFVVSIMPYSEFVQHPLAIFPTSGIDLQYYRAIFSNASIWNAIFYSVVKTGLATGLSVIITAAMAYGVSKRHIPGMQVVNVMTIVTMYFGGGLIPVYLLYRDLGLLRSFWAMVLPFSLNVGYYIIMRNYFLHELSSELEEAAHLDGANPIQAFFRVVLPTSAPMIAAVTLFIAVAMWNDWYSFHTYVNVPAIRPLANTLREILTKNNLVNSISNEAQALLGFKPPPVALRMATVIVATTPILIVYPFLQKYFAKGLMLGAVKG